MSADSNTTLVGTTLAGRYELVSLLGRGGMGTVYKGFDTQMSRRVVAVKVLAPHLVSDEKQVQRFEQEARAANQLRHPNTISVIDFGRDAAGHIFMVIEFLTGQELTSIVREGPMEPHRALYIMRQVCKSLAEAHSNNIVHRDLKPDNIFVCEIYGEKDFVKVIDFGIAKFLEDESAQLTQAGKMFGTPRYLSPEQAQGKKLDARSDLYTCGVILFECLTSKPPFWAEEAIAIAIKHVQEEPPRMEEVNPSVMIPPAVDSLVFKLLAKKADQRFQTAEEVVAAIDVALQQLGTGGGAFTPHAALTPARPITIPPPSSLDEATRMMPSLEEEPDATRAMDSAAVAAAAPAEDATMALDVAVAGGAASPAAATMALDAVAAQKALQDVKNKPAAAKLSAAPKPADSGMRNLVLLLIVAVLAAAAVGATVLGGNNASSKPAASRLPPTPRPDPAAQQRMLAQAESARKAAAEATAAAQALREQKAVLVKKAAAAAEHTVTIESTPPGADVLINDIVIGKTPYALRLQITDTEKVIKLRLQGYDDEQRTLTQAQIRTLVDAKVARLENALTKTVVAVAKPVAAAVVKPKKKKKKVSAELDVGGF